jgi:hypothetical protein
MSKFTFIHEQNYNNSKNTFEFEAVQLEDILEQFQYFLQGCGYNLDESHLEVVDNVEWNSMIESKEDDLDDLNSIFDGKKSLIRSDDC